MVENYIVKLFLFFLFVTMIISFYMFINVLQDRTKFKNAFSAWQFPMLFAIFLECYFTYK